jgi:2-amino-4-hydroxy-6-hydroxymethyldihydropteridine diphosphokinase
MPVRAAVALGSNLKEPKAQVRFGLRALSRIPSTVVDSQSSLYKSKPWGGIEQPDYINAVALVTTFLSAHDLLKELLALEKRHGRDREADVPNGPRTLDLDIITYGNEIIYEHDLKVPHPRAHQRAFVLAPLVEIAPHIIIPGRGSVTDLLRDVDATTVEMV